MIPVPVETAGHGLRAGLPAGPGLRARPAG